MAGFVFLIMSERHQKKGKAKSCMFSYEPAQSLLLKESRIFIPIINSTSLFSVIKIANPSHTPYLETCLSLAANEGRDNNTLLGFGRSCHSSVTTTNRTACLHQQFLQKRSIPLPSPLRLRKAIQQRQLLLVTVKIIIFQENISKKPSN